MATQVILPALGMAQETGIIVRWLKNAGEEVAKGEPLVEIETDKATVEIEAPASGVLANVTGAVGIEIPVGHVIAAILAPGESSQEATGAYKGILPGRQVSHGSGSVHRETPTDGHVTPVAPRFIEGEESLPGPAVSPLAARIAAEHNLDLSSIKSAGRRIQRADVLAHIQDQQAPVSTTTSKARLTPASPKARRLAAEQGKDLAAIQGTGPAGAVLVADVLAAKVQPVLAPVAETVKASAGEQRESAVSNTWRIMAERMTSSWTSAPHFYLVREVNASRLISWREQIQKRSTEKVTYTDLFVKIVAAALREHPRLNASWRAGTIILNDEIHIGLAVAVEQGLVVPVIHRADELSVQDIARLRKDLVARAQAGKLRQQDLQGGTFTISNLGMYGVDAFNAVINPPQAAILAIGRIAERVVPIAGQPSVQPMVVLSLTCDHRVVDGARGAQFLAVLAELVEEPLGLLH
jgi:pyruvate dehydrogenase E2 component (dihydrolipoamide acetyltransferase)